MSESDMHGPLLTMYSAEQLNEIIQGRITLPRFLILIDFLQDIGNFLSPFARLEAWPGEPLHGKILRIRTMNGEQVYRVREYSANHMVYLAEWVD